MKSQSITAFGKPLEETLRETPVPKGSEVLVRISHCGVCHSDVHLHDGYFELGGGHKLDITGGRPLPFTLGHEIAGTVEALGPEAEGSGLTIGGHYVVFPWIGCGACPTCARGDEHLCRADRALGISVNGGYADHVLVPHPRYVLDHDGIPDGLAATCMCSGLTAFSALKKIGRVVPGDAVAIVGLGGVGLMGLQFARALFPETRLIAADIDPAKLDAAKSAGADVVCNSRDADAATQVLAESGGGAYAALDFVGAESSFNFAQGIVRRGGKVVVVGLFGGALQMPLFMLPFRALSLLGSYVGSLAEAKEMLALVKAGRIDPIPITERPLDAATQTLDDLRAGKIVGRVVLRP